MYQSQYFVLGKEGWIAIFLQYPGVVLPTYIYKTTTCLALYIVIVPWGVQSTVVYTIVPEVGYIFIL